ncbi:MAG: phage baseplate assembly protein [Bradyrhizobium sp.]
MRDEFALVIGGAKYTGWTQIHITRGIAQLANSFDLSVSERFDGLGTVRPIRAGQAATISLAGEPVITGFVDSVTPNYDANTHSISVAGRDATGDLVDCAAEHKSGAWKNQSLAVIAFDLIHKFKAGLEVIANVGKPFTDWKIEPGETVFENLDRAARFRGVLLYSDGLGNLVIGKPATGTAPAALVLGENIVAAHGQSSALQRFSQYIVRAQQQGSDNTFGVAAAQLIGEAADAAVTRYRPTEIIAENESDAAGCTLRAQWQRTLAAARAQSIVYTVSGWRANGKLWQPNALVPVRDRFLGLDAERLISQVDFTLDAQGARTYLTVVGPHAYDAIALPEPASDGGLY